MNKPQIFDHQTFGRLPVVVIDGVEWFGATEAAKALSFSDPHKAIINHVDEDDSTVHPVIDSLGRTQQKKFINESGIYNLIFGAAKQGNNTEIREKARQFKRWVTSEVLPTIRKHGGYHTPDKIEEVYSQPNAAISKLIERNEYLADTEFSGVTKLTTPKGRTQETRLFTEDGIYEVTMRQKLIELVKGG